MNRTMNSAGDKFGGRKFDDGHAAEHERRSAAVRCGTEKPDTAIRHREHRIDSWNLA
jgi:hypothetical protein